jgi:hypothetical protein
VATGEVSSNRGRRARASGRVPGCGGFAQGRRGLGVFDGPWARGWICFEPEVETVTGAACFDGPSATRHALTRAWFWGWAVLADGQRPAASSQAV